MAQDSLWFGFLEIGEKSSPVLRDPGLRTANPDTIYLFNLKRNAIVEYKLAIVESKLRELSTKEGDTIKELKSAYSKVAKEFTAKDRLSGIPDSLPSKPAGKEKSKIKEEELEGVGDDDDFFDDDEDDS